MDLDVERRNTLEYLKEFNKSIPKKRSILSLSRKATIDNSKLIDMKDKVERFFEDGALISPMKIDKDSIDVYTQNVELVKQFTSDLKPDNIMENIIFEQTANARKTRTILLPSIVERNSNVSENYDKMVAYYMLMGGDKPIERFSKTEMQMKKYGVSPNIGSSIMKYGDELTTKLEELAMNNSKNSKEWEQFKNQVLHSYGVAEKIGNRNVNPEEHKEWEERLIRLGILERKLEKQDEQKIAFENSLKVDVKDKDKNNSKVLLDKARLEKARQEYIRTGMVPIGFKKNEEGQIVAMDLPKIEFDERANRLSASRDNLSATRQNVKKQEQEQLSR